MKNKKTAIFIGLFLFLAVIIAGYVVAAKYYGFFPFERADDKNTTSNAIKQDKAKKISDDKNTQSDQPSSQTTAQTSDQVPVGTTLNVEITAWQQTNRQVDAVAKTSGPGVCVFQYTTEGDKPVIRETQASGNECRTSIPELYFSKLGTWQLKVVYYNDGQKAEVLKDVSIQ